MRMITKLINNFLLDLNKMRLHHNKVHQRNQTMLKIFKLQMQPQEMHVSDLSLSKVTDQNILASSDLVPDIDPVQTIFQVFIKPFNHEPHTSHVLNQMRFFIPLGFDLEPEITTPTSRNIVVSSDMGPDPLAVFDSGGVIAQGLHGPFLLNSSRHDFVKVDKG